MTTDAFTFYELKFKNEFLEAKGIVFQDLFKMVMQSAHPGDFIPCRPWGNIGDRKNDGYLKSERTLFQVYAPNQFRLNDTISKINDDFSAALPYWKNYFDTWVFMHNALDGLPPDVIKKLLDLEHKHCPLKIKNWGYEELVCRFRKIPEETLRSRYGPAPGAGDVSDRLIHRIDSSLATLKQISRMTLADCGQISDERGSISLANLYVTRDFETDFFNKIRNCFGSLFITGAAGVGKTSLLWRLANRFLDVAAQVLFFRADYLASAEGSRNILSLPAVSCPPGDAIIFVDTIDAVVHKETQRTRLFQSIDRFRDIGYKVVAASRPLEKERYFPNDPDLKIRENYSDTEFFRVIETHVREFYALTDVETISQRMSEISAIFSGGAPVRPLAYNPLLLRMLFTVYAPQKIPSEINATSLYLEYWSKRIESDWRAGRQDKEPNSRDLSICASVIAEQMLCDGTIQLPLHQITVVMKKGQADIRDVHELITRGVLKRISISTEGDGIEFKAYPFASGAINIS